MYPTRRFVCLAALIALASVAPAVPASPECCERKNEPPLAQQFEDAQIILLGHFENARLAPNGLEQGVSDLVIERVFKDHPMVSGKKSITLSKYINDPKSKFLIFAEVYKGKIDAYKGVQLTDDAQMLKYIDGIRKLKGKSQAERLRFAFDYLTSAEYAVSADAYGEFARADYREERDMAKKLDPDKIAGWLKDPKTPPYRFGLYATLLGHCGKAKHAEFLMTMIKDPERRKSSGLHGLMMGYTLMEPEKGWTYLKALVRDKDEVFLTRYAGLLTMRFLYEAQADLVNKDQTAAKNTIVSDGILGVMSISDMADFAVEDLRKWKRWETCNQVLGIYRQKEFNTPIIRKSILRYALQCPNAAAKALVAAERNRDKEWVGETEELLNLETTPPTVTPASK